MGTRVVLGIAHGTLLWELDVGMWCRCFYDGLLVLPRGSFYIYFIFFEGGEKYYPCGKK